MHIDELSPELQDEVLAFTTRCVAKLRPDETINVLVARDAEARADADRVNARVSGFLAILAPKSMGPH